MSTENPFKLSEGQASIMAFKHWTLYCSKCRRNMVFVLKLYDPTEARKYYQCLTCGWVKWSKADDEIRPQTAREIIREQNKKAKGYGSR